MVWSGVSTCSIKQFTRLKLLRLDLLSQNFTSIADAPSTLHEVDMRNIVWPSPTIYANIASIFHHVRILRLRQPRPWCGLCNLCEFPNFCEGATETIKYEGGLGLPVSLINRYLPMSFCLFPSGSGTMQPPWHLYCTSIPSISPSATRAEENFQ